MIDEKKLIEDIEDMMSPFLFADEEREWALKDVIEVIENQPKVGEWIPVEKRLPSTYITVLITKYNQEVRTAFLDGDHYWFDGLWTYTFDDVLAWQPLPEPYKGD